LADNFYAHGIRLKPHLRKLSGNRQEPLGISLDLFDQLPGKIHLLSGPNITQWQTPHGAQGRCTKISQTGRDLAQRQLACVTEFRQVLRHNLFGNKLVSDSHGQIPLKFIPIDVDVQ